MGFELFEKEQRVIDQAKRLIASGEITQPEVKAGFQALLKDYQKLTKSSKRLVRLSDKNEAQLNALAKSLDEKTKVLEGLSAKLGKYLPPQVYDSIFSGTQTAELVTKRKKLTVFFSDIKNFTEITENMQPEDLTWLLNSYFHEMSYIALEFGGTIDKFVGDAMLIFFGDPNSFGVREDALACVGMAIAMQQRMTTLQKEWAERGYSQPFQCRIGINTGYCNVGNFGSDQRMDYTIIGSEVNLAARLESNAEPGGILLSYETMALVNDVFETEPFGEVSCKGFHAPVPVYAVTSFDEKEAGEKTEFEATGFTLSLNPKKMAKEDKAQAIQALEQARILLEEDGHPTDSPAKVLFGS